MSAMVPSPKQLPALQRLTIEIVNSQTEEGVSHIPSIDVLLTASEMHATRMLLVRDTLSTGAGH